MRSPWPSEQIRMLLRMQAAGSPTRNMAREIVVRFGVVRSPRAILNKLRRLARNASKGLREENRPDAGARYGNLVFVEPVPRRGRLWRLRCDCGASITVVFLL
jgi:hypothetical protein